MLTAEQRVQLIREYGQAYRIFVETGTADGFTTIRLVNDFDRLITIELDYDRYIHVAAQDFMFQPKVMPLCGDSRRVLYEVLHWLRSPALFWLDAHYNGGVRIDVDSPADTELEMILAWSSYWNVACTVLIDDARDFGTDPGYPTIERLDQLATAHRRSLLVQDDVIRITQRGN